MINHDVDVPLQGRWGRKGERVPVFWGDARALSDGPYVPELRDTSKPIAFDEHGNPLYAPSGRVFRVR